ncbi:MAG: response regulator [Alphaproteobacteria bacterium]|nr:response regulator [Alphaproteobacteria bacterium]
MDKFLFPDASSDGTPSTGNGSRRLFGRPQLHVLSAEDHPANQLLIRLLLKKLHCTCQIVNDGAEASRALQHPPIDRPYDLVLMDIYMPVMDGFEAARAIRKLPGPRAQLPILALTGDAQDAVRTQALAAGMNDVLSKPMEVRAFQKALEYWGRRPNPN